MNIGLTALTEFWGDSHDLILTGEWCKNNNIDIQSSSRNITIHPYPWDNRSKLYSSYLYTNSVYQSFLPIIADTLNTYHSEKNSTHYWEIIIGIWLKYFIQTLFDKYTLIKEISDVYDCLECLVVEDKEFVPIDFDNYYENSTSSHYYNQLIFSQILQKLDTSIKIKSKKIFNQNFDIEKKHLTTDKKNRAINYFLSSFNILGSKKTLIHKSGYNVTKELMLALSYKTLPRYFIKFRADTKVDIDSSFRRDQHIKETSDEFVMLLSNLVFRNMPSSYIESYGDTLSCLKKNLNSIPRAIITSNTLVSDEYMKVLTAYCTERGSKLVIHQHGGHYGAGKFLPIEDHEVSISDLFLTWGWSDRFRPNIKPFYCTKKYSLGECNLNSKKILVIANSSPLYTKYLYSAPISSQVIEGSNDLIKALENLPSKLRECIVYRLKSEKSHHNGWDLSNRLISEYNEVNIENSSVDYFNSLSSSSLVISTYNATTFLESFIMGIPTLLFWDSNYQEIRDDALEYFEELERVGILHHDPLILAKKINEISGDICSWWNQEEVTKSVNFFCNYFIKQTSNIKAKHKKMTLDLFN